MGQRATDHFVTELEKLIQRFRQEYHITYAELVGVLTLAANELATECREIAEEDEQ